VITALYYWAHSFSKGLALVELNGKWGYIDTKGALVIPGVYDKVCGFSEGFASVKLNGRYGRIDTKGNEAPMSGSRAEYYLREGME
jgi:hypothetical protein